MQNSKRPLFFSLSNTPKNGGWSAENRRRWSTVAVPRSTENNLSSFANSISALVDSAASSISCFLDDAKESAEKTVRDLQLYWVDLTDKRCTREEAREFYQEKYSNKKNIPAMEYADKGNFKSLNSRFLSTTRRSLPKNTLLKKLESYLYETQPTHGTDKATNSAPIYQYTNSPTDSLQSMSKGNFSKTSRTSVSRCPSSSKENASSSKATVTVKRQRSYSYDVTRAHVLEKRQCFDVPSEVLQQNEVHERERIRQYDKPKAREAADQRDGPEQMKMEPAINLGGPVLQLSDIIPEDDRTHKDFLRAYEERSRVKLLHETKYTQTHDNIFSASEKSPGIVSAVLHVTVQYQPVTRRLRLKVEMASGIRAMGDQHKNPKTFVKVNIMLNGRCQARKTKKKSGKEIVEFDEDLYFDNLSIRDAHLLCLRFRLFRKCRRFPRSRSHFVGEAFVFLDGADIVSETLSLKLVSTE